ncbi:putative phage tail protein [Yersinia rohdei]|uniref:prophage tail fiber N-terminal domain-containing protein n=1 Tax=Yersinia rohdei TaxID=29485 RepID=UPI00061C2D8D|nr:prophage tail fiber N-terminal domain-containing protein [Yersinia rohdei]CNE63662.1 putative phage tail protein [Yersinia rohdei]
MSIKISGILPGPTGEPAAHIGITLRAVKTSLTVVATLESNSITGVDGSYSLNVEPGQYNVLLWVDGINARNVGTITVYSDSLPGTLNNFLTALREEDGTPEIIRQLEQLRAEASQAAFEAKQSKDEATTQASIATNAAENAAQETADLITATVKGDADRAEAAREGAETAQSSVNTLAGEVALRHAAVEQLTTDAEGSATAAANSAGSAALSASESESSKNAAVLSEQVAAVSAELAETSATAAADDKTAAKGFRDEAEGFAAQAKSSADSIDVSALEDQINNKVSQTALEDAINTRLPLGGGTMTGELTLYGDATAGLEAVTLDQLKRMGGLPIGFVSWCTMRSKIRAGEAPLDGQILTRSLFPDFFAELAAGNHPIASDADWLADPLKRGAFTLGDGSTTFRLADLNGKSPGSIGRLFLGGDGTNSAGTNGLIQLSENKAHIHAVTDPGHAHVKAIGYRRSGTTYTDENYWGRVESDLAVDGNLYTRTAPTGISINSTGGTEARPNNATGCYTIKLAGAALNSGQVDALALASSIAALATRVTTVEGIAAISFTTAQMTTTVWEKLTVGGGWTGEFWYRRVLGSLQIHCDLVAPGPANGATLTVLPVGYRPKVNATLVPWAPRDASAMPMRLLIQSNTGTVLIGNLGSAGPISGEFFVPFE